MKKPNKVTGIIEKENSLLLYCDIGVLKVIAYADNIIQIIYYPSKEEIKLPMWGINAVPRRNTIFQIEIGETEYFLKTSAITVGVSKVTCQVKFYDKNSKVILESDGYYMDKALISNENTYNVFASFKESEDECYYGLGQHQSGWMNHRGQDVILWHDYSAKGGEIIGVPFMVTNKEYGFIFDNCSRTKVAPGKNGLTSWSSEVGDAISYFYIYGENTDEIYRGYRFITGETPLPPKAALGYIQCKQRYKDREELMSIAKTYRLKEYPCDMLVVDWFHWKTLGDLSLDESFWPDVEGMNKELKEMNYKVMISCWPRFMKEGSNYETLEKNGWFMTDENGKTVYGIPEDQRGALIDTTNPECGAWYWNTIYKNYANKGFTSWWLDENEPDISPYKFNLFAGTGARVHNIYPLTHTKCVYEGHRRDLEERCLILSRAAYLGAQSNGTTFWSSDIYPEWDVLKKQISTGLNFCATGFSYWSSDIGGWQPLRDSNSENDSYKSLLIETNNKMNSMSESSYNELYVRWFQFGAFSPTFRTHGTRNENEVWSYGSEAEKILVKYLKLRYRLMPYIYSLAYNTYKTGAPFMRALFMDFPKDSKVLDIKDEYMFGPAFLVIPVVERGQTKREVYLPAGTDWYNYWTKQKYSGGQTIIVDAPIDTLPLFVKAGTILPSGENIQNTSVEQKKLKISIYGGADASFEIYQDDGTTYAYEQDEFTLIKLTWCHRNKTLIVEGDDMGLLSRPQAEWLNVIE